MTEAEQQEIIGIPNNSFIHKLITSGRPGMCALCGTSVKKLEAHHIKYSPEVTIDVCHNCHHTCHFWPLRLSESQRYRLFRRITSESSAAELSKKQFLNPSELSKLIAPSRRAFQK